MKLRQGLSLTASVLAATLVPCSMALADGSSLATSLLSGPVSASTAPPAFDLTQQLNSLAQIGRYQDSQLTNPIFGLQNDPSAAVSLPLMLQTGKNSGISLLYYTPPSLLASPDGKAPTLNSDGSKFGFSNSLAIGGSLQLNGLLYTSDANTATGSKKSSEILSQALNYSHGGLSLQAHYDDVGKDFSGFGALGQASGSLGFLSGQTTQTLAALQKMVGQKDLGFSANFQDKWSHASLNYQDVNDSVNLNQTLTESMSLARTFQNGLSLGMDMQTVDLRAFAGGTQTPTTTTTDHYHLGFAPNKNSNLVADMTDVSTTGSSQRTENVTFNQILKTLSFNASYLNLAPSNGVSQTTESVQWAWQARSALKIDGLMTDKSNPNGVLGDDHLQQAHLNWQMYKGLTFDSQWMQETDSAWKQATNQYQMTLQGQLARNFQINALMASKTDGSALTHENDNSLQATVTVPRFIGMKNAQWMLSFAQRITQSQMQNRACDLTFDAQFYKTALHLEGSGTESPNGTAHSKISTRALRLSNANPNDWLQYKLFYDQRHQSNAPVGTPTLPDLREYQVSMRLRALSLQYHYLNQQLNPDGSVTDTVQSSYSLSGPMSKTMNWTAAYNQTNIYAGTAGTQGFSVGVKGNVNPKTQMELGFGEQQTRDCSNLVSGQTYTFNYHTNTDSTHTIGLDSQIITWDKQTASTPKTLVATIRLDLNKAY